MSNPFKPATKEKARLRMALLGPSGGGKTYTALILATALAQGGKVAVIDTEHGSASKYANEFKFDVVDLGEYSPRSYINMIQAADQNGYEVLIIDSLSHAWNGKGGVLEMVDRAAKRSNSQNSFTAWRDVTPEHNALIEAILATKAHIIVTMRSKSEYVLVTTEKGKIVPQRIGLAPVQRDGTEYEFDILAEIDIEHTMVVTKSRCPDFADMVVTKPGAEIAEKLRAWLTDGAEPAIDQTKSVSIPNIADMSLDQVIHISSAPASQPDPARIIGRDELPAPQPEAPVTRAERSVADAPADRQPAREIPEAAKTTISDIEIERYARKTFPWATGLMLKSWGEFMTQFPEWNKQFYAGTKAIGLDDDAVHQAAGVVHLQDFSSTETALALWIKMARAALELNPTA